MIAYKLFQIKRDGQLASLFINKKARYSLDEWLTAEDIPTKGYAPRYGWHCTNSPNAPHLSMKNRTWFEVEIEDYSEVKRPASQGGIWYIAKQIKINKQL